MSKVQTGLKYSAEHEWINDDSPVTVGISAVAADALGEVVYVELPEVGAVLTAGAVCGEIESTKSVSELFAPVSGEVVQINEAAAADPSIINADPYGEGWLFAVEPTAAGELLTAAEYADKNGVSA